MADRPHPTSIAGGSYDGTTSPYIPGSTLSIDPSLTLHREWTDEIDAITCEVIRHNLWNINEELGMAIQRISGSPVAMYTFDLNSSIFTEDGEFIYYGPYQLYMSGVSDDQVKWTLEHRSKNPRIFAALRRQALIERLGREPRPYAGPRLPLFRHVTEYLDLVGRDGAAWLACTRCGQAALPSTGKLQAPLPPDRPPHPGRQHAHRRPPALHRRRRAVPPVLLPRLRRPDRERGVPGAGPRAPGHRAGGGVGRARSGVCLAG